MLTNNNDTSKILIKDLAKLHFFTTNLRNLDEETQDIIESIFYFLNEKIINKSTINNNFKFYTKVKHDYKKNNGLEFEIDGLSLMKLNKKNIIFFAEFKNYSTFINVNKDDIVDHFEKGKNKTIKFRKYIFNDKEKVQIFYLFTWKHDNKISYKFLEIKNINPCFEKVDNILAIKKINNLLNNDSLVYCDLENFKKELVKPIDIQNLLEAFLNTRKMFENNEEKNIKKKISDNKISLFYGSPGTGKTTLSFYILGSKLINNISTKLIILNNNFVENIKGSIKHELKTKKYNKSNEKKLLLLLYNSLESSLYNIESFLDIEYLIIDEAQRLNEYDYKKLNKLVNNTKIKIILLGDQFQMLNPKLDIGYEKFLSNVKHGRYELQKYFRLPKDDIDKIHFCFCISKFHEPKFKSKYKIYNHSNLDDFVNSFKKSCEKELSILCTLQNVDFKKRDILIRNKGFMPASRELKNREKFLEIKKYQKKYYFFAYDLISREVSNVYIFIPKCFLLKNGKLYSDEVLPLEIFISQLNILLTRAINSIHVFIEDYCYRDEVNWRISISNWKV